MPRKSWIATAAETVQAVAEPVAEAVKAMLAAAPFRPSGDPWYRDDERREEVNRAAEEEREAASGRGWLPRRRRWLERD